MLYQTIHAEQRLQDRGFNDRLTQALFQYGDVLQHRLRATLFVSCSRKRLKELAQTLRREAKICMIEANQSQDRHTRKLLKQQSREIRQAAEKLERKNRPYFIATVMQPTVITYGYQYKRLRHKTNQGCYRYNPNVPLIACNQTDDTDPKKFAQCTET